MKKSICLTLLLGFISLAFAQKAKETSALQSMVDTERAFAKMSEEQGVRPAFMSFIADDGILFRPTAVKGKQWMNYYRIWKKQGSRWKVVTDLLDPLPEPKKN